MSFTGLFLISSLGKDLCVTLYKMKRVSESSNPGSLARETQVLLSALLACTYVWFGFDKLVLDYTILYDMKL